MCNPVGNGVRIVYTNATNVTNAEVLLEVTLTRTANVGKATLTIDDCFDQYYNNVTYEIIGHNVEI